MGTGTTRQDVLVPVEQDAIPFYGHELVAVRLEGGRICAVLRWLCEGLSLDPQAQLRRIQRKTALTDGLVVVRVATEGGPQAMPALTLDVLPGWLFGIDENRVKPEASGYHPIPARVRQGAGGVLCTQAAARAA